MTVSFLIVTAQFDLGFCSAKIVEERVALSVSSPRLLMLVIAALALDRRETTNSRRRAPPGAVQPDVPMEAHYPDLATTRQAGFAATANPDASCESVAGRLGLPSETFVEPYHVARGRREFVVSRRPKRAARNQH